MNIVGCIFARGGSKGVPRKNIRPLAGKPLIAYAIEAALQTPSIQRLIVSTDDPEIADVARRFGAEVPFMRPPELAADTSPEWLSWQHAIRTLGDVDVLVSVPATAPLRTPADVENCIQTLLNSDADITITVTPAARSPFFTMVVFNEGGYIQRVIPTTTQIYRRQDAPPVFDITPLAYVVRAPFVLRENSMFNGKMNAVIVPQERALDIDTEQDFEIAEFLIQKRLRK